MPERLIPADLDAFDEYVTATAASLEVTNDARRIAREVLQPRFWWAPRPLFVPIEWVTVDLLDPDLAEAYGLPRLTSGQRRVLRTARRATRSVLPHLPDPLLSNPLNKRAIA